MTHKQVTIAELIYDAAEELLSGTLGSDMRFHVQAYSGGSRGHNASVAKTASEKYLYSQALTLSSRLANTPTIEEQGHYKQRGGTLPAGHYGCQYLAHHHSFGECIQLIGTNDTRAIYSPFSPHPIPHYRHNDFFIHGSGPKGSDGCIVIVNGAERHRLNNAIKGFPGKVVLVVKDVAYRLPAELEGQLA